MTEPTPRPWYLDGDMIRDADGNPMCLATCEEAIKQTLRAVNCHDALVAAAKDLYIHECPVHKPTEDGPHFRWHRLFAVLTKVRELESEA